MVVESEERPGSDSDTDDDSTSEAEEERVDSLQREDRYQLQDVEEGYWNAHGREWVEIDHLSVDPVVNAYTGITELKWGTTLKGLTCFTRKTKIVRKPEGVGCELKSAADGMSGIILQLELMEGSEAQSKKPGHAEYGEADSAFSSVKSLLALLDQGLYFMGMVKTATKSTQRSSSSNGLQAPDRSYAKSRYESDKDFLASTDVVDFTTFMDLLAHQLIHNIYVPSSATLRRRSDDSASVSVAHVEDQVQHKLRSLTELPMYKENIMNGKYPQRICKYCKMKTTFYCSDLENDYLVSYCGFGHFQRLLYSSSHRNGFLKLIDSLILNARPALDNEDFGRERDIEELQNEDEADELMLSGEQHVVQISPDVNPLEPHGQKWEVLDAGIPVCQRAAAGLGMNDLRIKWSNQPYSVEDCFNIMHVSPRLL
ncbi:hypothetical protein EMCRGX_G014573 [Ephydatia muelleri]